MVELDDSRYKPVFIDRKFREAVLYICVNSTSDLIFGSVKLNKILYYSDFAAFRQLGKPITGATYIKLDEGPAPLEMPGQRRILVENGDAEMKKYTHFTGTLNRLVPKRQAYTDIFYPVELSILDEVTHFFIGKTECEASDFSKSEIGWILAERMEIIPYDTAWLSSEPITQEDEEYIRANI